VVLFVFQLGGVVVPQDIAQLGLGDVAGHLAKVVEAFPALGGLGAGHVGQGQVELHGHVGGVDHGVFGAAGVDRQPPHRDGGRGGVEVFVLDAAHVPAVYGVGKGSPEALQIEQAGPLADLFVGGKGDAQLAVGRAGLLQGLDGGHDLGHAGLVVGPQQGGAVGGDQGLALHAGQEGEVLDPHHRAGGGQGDVPAVVVLVQDGADVFAGGVGGGVHVGDQAQGGPVLAAGRGGQGAVNIAVLVHGGVLHPQGLEFLHQHPGQIELALGGGVGPGQRVGG